MLFKSYTPSTPETKHLVRLYGYLKRVTGKDKPTKDDYYQYIVDKAGLHCALTIAKIFEKREELKEHAQKRYDQINEQLAKLNYPSWEEIKVAVNRNPPEYGQNVAYIIIFSKGGIKCGQTNNFTQRCYSIMRENGNITKAMYLPLDNKTEALVAENALQTFFGRSKGMKKVLGKMDYFDCDLEYAEKFLSNNKRKIYDSIMEAIEGV